MVVLTAFGRPVVPELKDKKPPAILVSRDSISHKPPQHLTLTNIEIRLPLRNGIIRHLLILLLAHLNQLLDCSMPTNLSLQQEQVFLRDPSILRRLHSNLHTIRMRHQELRVRRLERISHLLNIVSVKKKRLLISFTAPHHPINSRSLTSKLTQD
jgi:hypothetical protein